MKLSTRDKNLLIFLLVAVILACSYFLGYQKLVEDKEGLEKEIEALDKKIKTKKEQLEKKDFYEIMTNVYAQKFEEELKKFPEDIQEENQIMFFKEIEQFLTSEEDPFMIPTVSFSEGQTIVKFKETEKATGEHYEGKSSTVTFPFTLTYDKFKELLSYLEGYEDRSVVSTISASYNEDLDVVSGTVIFTQYAIAEETRILLKPEIEDILLGTDNIFTSPSDLDIPEGEVVELTVKQIADRVKASFDMFVLLEPINTEFPTTTLGFADSTALLRDNKNEQQLISIIIDEIVVDDLTKPIFNEKGIHVQDDNGKFLYEPLIKPVMDSKTGLQAVNPQTGELIWENAYEYRVTYIIGEGDNAVKVENILIQPADYLDVYVYSSDRVYAEETESKQVDKASVKATIVNNTTKYDKVNIFVVENNFMTEEEKDALAKEEALREEEGKGKREDLTIQRWTIDEEKSTMDKINVITTTDVASFLENPEENSSEASSEESSEEIIEESSEAVSEESSVEV